MTGAAPSKTKPKPITPFRRLLGHLATAALVIAAAALLLKRFGLLH
ncbi:MAG TPA: hypothetical protein VH374_16670 [Polyangia bacterium]|nr:hypothetical protein [Polyangia bacterium]